MVCLQFSVWILNGVGRDGSADSCRYQRLCNDQHLGSFPVGLIGHEVSCLGAARAARKV